MSIEDDLLNYLTRNLAGLPLWCLASSDAEKLLPLQAATLALLDRGLVTVYVRENLARFLPQAEARAVLRASESWVDPSEVAAVDQATEWWISITPEGLALAEGSG